MLLHVTGLFTRTQIHVLTSPFTCHNDSLCVFLDARFQVIRYQPKASGKFAAECIDKWLKGYFFSNIYQKRS